MFFPFIYKVLTSFSGFLFSGEPGIYVSPRFQGKPAFKKQSTNKPIPEEHRDEDDKVTSCADL